MLKSIGLHQSKEFSFTQILWKQTDLSWSCSNIGFHVSFIRSLMEHASVPFFASSWSSYTSTPPSFTVIRSRVLRFLFSRVVTIRLIRFLLFPSQTWQSTFLEYNHQISISQGNNLNPKTRVRSVLTILTLNAKIRVFSSCYMCFMITIITLRASRPTTKCHELRDREKQDC